MTEVCFSKPEVVTAQPWIKIHRRNLVCRHILTLIELCITLVMPAAANAPAPFRATHSQQEAQLSHRVRACFLILNNSLIHSRSFKVIGNDTIQYIAYEFLLAFHYGSILYHFRDKTRYWSKISIFSYPCIRRGSHRNIAITFGKENLEWCGYPKVKKVWWYV